MRIYVAYYLGIFVVLLGIAWSLIKFRGWKKYEIQKYQDFKKEIFATQEQSIVLLPGSTNIFSSEQVVAINHCQRLLLKNKSAFETVSTSIITNCPFKHEILQEFISTHSINAKIEFLSPEYQSFTMASMGFIDRNKPAVTLINGTLGIESLLLGEIASQSGSVYQGSDSYQSLSDAAPVSKEQFICEEMYSLPAYESEEPADLVFLLAGNLSRALIIIAILGFSIKETIAALV